MGFDKVITSLVMHVLTLFTRRHIPKDYDPYQSPTIFYDKSEMDLPGFTNTGLNVQTAFEFSEDLLWNWITHSYPATKGNHVENT